MMHRELAGRNIRKSGDIAANLRAAIVGGKYAPGQRLPTQQDLVALTGAAVATVQKVFNQLADEGFIGARSQAGTFVSETPPHLFRYGVVFPFQSLPSLASGTLLSSLALQCQTVERNGRYQMALFFGVDGHTDVPDYIRIVEDLKRHRMAGLLLGTNPRHLVDTPLVRDDGIPRVILGSEPFSGIPAVTTDTTSWIRAALDQVTDLGRRRVAVVATSMSPEWFNLLDAGVSERGLVTQPHWRILVHPGLPEGARNAVHLLLESPEPPDVILVADDVFTDATVAGILDARRRVGEDIDIVAHCNFPLLRADQLPIRRIGFSVPSMLDCALRLINDRQRGGALPPVTRIAASKDTNVGGTAGQTGAP